MLLLLGAGRFVLTGLYKAAVGGTALEQASGWLGTGDPAAAVKPQILQPLGRILTPTITGEEGRGIGPLGSAVTWL